jgi:hypothetical protein
VQIVPSETKAIYIVGDGAFYPTYTKVYFDTDLGKLLSQIIFQLVLLTVYILTMPTLKKIKV